MTSADLPHRLRDALTAASYTYDAVVTRLGPQAYAALDRNETVPGRRATTAGSPLDTLIRLFLLQTTVASGAAERALPNLIGKLVEEGLLAASGDQVRAVFDVRPYAAHVSDDGPATDLWVVSDLTPGLDGAPIAVAADHVLGISSASTSLAQLTLRHPVGTALDLGTGCGVQALHLAHHANRVIATDVNERALWCTRLNAALNGVNQTGAAARIETRAGSFFEPVSRERFDLITTNPPFVISPATDERLVYRDSGLPGDRAVEQIVRAAPSHLTDGGWCQILANWVITEDQLWSERLATWIAPPVDAFVVQREVVDPATYVELWLKDSGHHGAAGYLERYDTWLGWLEAQGVAAIGFGWINLRRHEGGRPGRVDLRDWPYEVEQPIAPAVAAWGEGADLAATLSADDTWLLGARLAAAPDLVQEARGAVAAEDPETIVVRRQRGLRQARQVDTVTAALIGACDGELTVGQILDALAQLLGGDPADLRRDTLPLVTELLTEGYLASADPT